MNFFREQDKARRNTVVLLVLLVLAVLSLVAVTVLAVALSLYFFSSSTSSVTAASRPAFFSYLTFQLQSGLLLWVALGVVGVVVSGSLYKLVQLGGSGLKVALALGGKPVLAETRDADEKKLLNVVEEMAIASGNPVPRVFVLEEEGINAFAAGTDRRNAVIGVTRGCINSLTRDELQGVIAHEFSHIHFGDMRLNQYLVTLLHGILAIGLVGELILHSGRGHGRKNHAAQIGLGMALFAIGYCGVFFGNLIKAAVSRQREFLADASAVQFTRNPSGIGQALKKIGGSTSGSLLQAPHAAEFSHFYFGQGVRSAFVAWFDTHPPLEKRIRRVEPGWNGRFITPNAERATPTSGGASPSESTSGFASAATGPATSAEAAIETIGQTSSAHIAYARTLLQEIPDPLSEAAHLPQSAVCLVYALALDRYDRAAQLNILPAPLRTATDALASQVARLERRHYLPLLELATPALKQVAPDEYKVFKQTLAALIRADNKVSLFEWCLFKSVTLTIEARAPREDKALASLGDEVMELLHAVCAAGSTEPACGLAAAREFLPHLPEPTPGRTFSVAALDRAMNSLARLKPLEKPRLLKAVANCINLDRTVTVEEAELFRAVADILNCPVPPLLVARPQG